MLVPCTVLALTALVAAPQSSSRDALAKPFAYDASRPIDEKVEQLYERDGITTFEVMFPSPRGGMVTGYLVVPAGKGPFAGLVFGHWGPGNSTEFLPEANLYAEAGAVSVMIDYPWVRRAPWRVDLGRGLGQPEKDRDGWIAAVVDLRRAIDLLAARRDVDRARIGYVGHSYGAQWGAILAAVDRRIKSAVLVGGVPSTESIVADSDDPDIVTLRAAHTKEQLERYFEISRPFDAVRYVPHAAPVPLFFQFARHERYFNAAAMKEYYDAASEPKEVRWYDTGHDLNDVRVLADRASWLAQRLGLGDVRLILERRIRSNVK